MKRFLFSSFLILLWIPVTLSAQRDSVRNLYLDAESWFLFEEYEEALPLYEALLKGDPGNDNYKYKIGICLLNNPYQKDRAIKYLVDASDNINPSYKMNSFKEWTAPPDVLYHLGDAYLVNELLNKAIESYEEFLKIMDKDIYDEELVQTQIRACKNAQRLKTMAVDIDLTLLDSLINTRYADINPVISGDGTKLAFITKLPFYDGAFFCEKTDQGWSYPQPITQTLGFDADVYPVCLSHDGTEMIIYYDDEYIGNLYYSKFEEGRWLPATKLGENISTKYWESHASFSKDGQTLYFTSNRKGTHGGLDIYRSHRESGGKWGVPENLGPTINSRYNEECPYISEDGQILYFSSYGHYNMGGYDVFYSKLKADSTWGEPVNMGYPINTTDDDLFFQPVNNGVGAYYSLYSPRGMGLHDIYFMDIYSVDNPRMYVISGTLKTEDRSLDSSLIDIFVVDSSTGDTILNTSPEQDNRSFSFKLKQGDYQMHFTADGHEDLIRPLHITSDSDKGGIDLHEIELALIPRIPIIFEGDESLIKLKDTLYVGVVGEPVNVPVRAKKDLPLIVRTYKDSALVSTDTMMVEKRKIDLVVIAQPDTIRIELEVTDEDGNLHRNNFRVVGIEPVGVVIEETPEKIPEEEPQLPAARDGALGLLLLQLQEKSEGCLEDLLAGVDPEKEGLRNERELFEHLYKLADSLGCDKKEIDLLLADVLAQDDVALLHQLMIEHSDGSLKRYLEDADPYADGIRLPEYLIRYLWDATTAEGFTEEEIREVLLDCLGKHLEVDQVYNRLLKTSDNPVKEILKDLDLRAEGIYTVEDLIRVLYDKLEAAGYKDCEILEILTELFPDHVEYIKELSMEGDRKGERCDKKGWPAALLIGLGAGFLLLIFLWWRRRKKKEDKGE